MKHWVLVPLLVMAVGCSGGSKNTQGADQEVSMANAEDKSLNSHKSGANTSKELEKFGNDVFGVPPYPGSEIVQYSSIEMDSDVAHSYNRHYKTSDSVDKVTEYYMTEGAKVGNLGDTAIMNKPGSPMRMIVVVFSADERLQIQAMKIPKGGNTDISVHLTKTKKK